VYSLYIIVYRYYSIDNIVYLLYYSIYKNSSKFIVTIPVKKPLIERVFVKTG